MKISEIQKGIKGVFKSPIKQYYFGKILYHTPYFLPTDFNSNILFLRRLKLKSQEELTKSLETYPYYKNKLEDIMFTNLPMVRRNKNWTFKLFSNWYHIQIGWPFAIGNLELGWKDKFNSPRAEWNPMFYIFFFHWQFCIHWTEPTSEKYPDKYWEQILWYLCYSGKDIKKAEETWPWSCEGKSTWSKKYLV